MPRRPNPDRPARRDRQAGFFKGLNLAADASWLDPAEARKTQNARLTEFGGVTRRGGLKNIHATAVGVPSTVRGGFTWRKAASTQHLCVANGKLNTTAYAALPTTWTEQTGSLSTSAVSRFAAFWDGAAEVVYIADGGLLNKWDGTTLTTDTASTPAATVLAVYNERLFGITGTDDLLYWSAIADGDTLGIGASGGGSARVRTFGNQKLTGLLALGSSLLLFHVDGISRFTGISLDDIAIASGTQGVSQDVGTISPGSIVAVENTGYFCTSRGVYRVTEAGVQDVSAKIAPVFQSLASTDLDDVLAAHSKNTREVWFFVPGKGVYAYNYRLDAWSGPWDGGWLSPNTTALWDGVNTSGTPCVFRANTSGFVQQADLDAVYLDGVLSDGTGGSAYTFEVQCHRMFLGDQAAEKALRWGYLTSDLRGGTNITVNWQVGSDTGSTSVTGSGTALYFDSGLVYDGGLTYTQGSSDTRQFPLWGRGRFVDVSIVDDQASDALYSAVELDGFDMTRR